MATISRIQPYWAGNSLNATEPLFHGGPEALHWKETASQSYGVGDLLYLDTNGTIAICTLTGTIHNSAIIGQAITAATGTTGASVFLRVIRPDDLFVMNVTHTTVASAVTVQTLLGLRKGLQKLVSCWGADIENAVEGAADALARVKIVDFPLRSPSGETVAIGDVLGLELVNFVPFSMASDGNPNQFVLQGA